MPQPKAILFDLDGTLVDSVPLWIEADLRALEVLNVFLDSDTFLKDFYHHGLHYEGILEKCGIDAEHGKEFYKDRDNRFADLLSEKVEWTGAAEKVLQRCAAKVPLGVMTGSRRRFIDSMDKKLKLSALFTAFVTRDDTGQKMKPDPYGLLLLAERLSVAPKDCLYVGDQAVDVQGAKKAQMSVCLLKTKETPAGAGKGADSVINQIENLLQILGY